MTVFRSIVSFLFPDRCVGCASLGSLLCRECGASLAPAPGCAQPWVTALYAYADPRVSALVRLLKYKGVRRAADCFAPALAGALEELVGEEGYFLGTTVLLVPVPLSPKRRARRGYNQAELLARAALAERSSVHSDNPMSSIAVSLDTRLLVKTRETEAQAGIRTRAERLSRLEDCFAVIPGRACAGETVVLIDDVVTTGATLAAAAQALARAGFSDIRAIVVAH